MAEVVLAHIHVFPKILYKRLMSRFVYQLHEFIEIQVDASKPTLTLSVLVPSSYFKKYEFFFPVRRSA